MGSGDSPTQELTEFLLVWGAGAREPDWNRGGDCCIAVDWAIIKPRCFQCHMSVLGGKAGEICRKNLFAKIYCHLEIVKTVVD
jgi:hypothetical protein